MNLVKRLEIVVEAPYSEHVTSMLDRHGVDGWTLIRGASGSGERGEQFGDEITGVSNNHLILSTCAPEKFDALATDLRKALERFGGVRLISDSQTLLP